MRGNLYEYGLTINESTIHLKSDKKEAIMESIEKIKYHRQELTNYVRDHPDFQYALKPVKMESTAPRIVQLMVKSSRVADVGPMASVAGALADFGLEAMLKTGANIAVVENGGEIAAYTRKPILVTILSGSLKLSGKIGFNLTEDDCPLGIATSSSKTGHAISFGEADSVTIVADTASLADAAATSVCNSVVGKDVKKSVQMGLERAKGIKGIRGALIIRGEHVGIAGRLPRIIKIKE